MVFEFGSSPERAVIVSHRKRRTAARRRRGDTAAAQGKQDARSMWRDCADQAEVQSLAKLPLKQTELRHRASVQAFSVKSGDRTAHWPAEKLKPLGEFSLTSKEGPASRSQGLHWQRRTP
jgi:hypothetical protein